MKHLRNNVYGVLLTMIIFMGLAYTTSMGQQSQIPTVMYTPGYLEQMEDAIQYHVDQHDIFKLFPVISSVEYFKRSKADGVEHPVVLKKNLTVISPVCGHDDLVEYCKTVSMSLERVYIQDILDRVYTNATVLSLNLDFSRAWLPGELESLVGRSVGNNPTVKWLIVPLSIVPETQRSSTDQFWKWTTIAGVDIWVLDNQGVSDERGMNPVEQQSFSMIYAGAYPSSIGNYVIADGPIVSDIEPLNQSVIKIQSNYGVELIGALEGAPSPYFGIK